MTIRELITVLGFKYNPTAFNQYDQAIGEIHKKTADLGKNLKRVSEGIANAGKAMTMRLTLPIVGLGTASVMASGEMEKMDVMLGRFLGKGEDVQDFTRRLWEVQRQQGLGIKATQEATQTLFGLGFAADDVLDTITMLSDIAATGKMEIGALADTYGKAMVRNRVSSREFIRLQSAGIDIIKEMAEATGVSEEAMRGMAERSEIQFKHLQAGFRNMTREGGRFHGLAQEMDRTVPGAWNNIFNGLFRVRRVIGDVIVDTLKLDKVFQGIANWLEAAAEYLKSLPAWLQRISVITAVILALLGPLLFFLGNILGTMVLMQLAVTALGKASIASFKKMALALLPLFVKFAIIAAILGALWLLVDDIVGYFQGRDSVFGLIMAWIDGLWKKWSAFFESVGAEIAQFIRSAKTAIGEFMDWLYEVGEAWSAWFDKIINEIKEKIQGIPVLGRFAVGMAQYIKRGQAMEQELLASMPGGVAFAGAGQPINVTVDSKFDFNGAVGGDAEREAWRETAEQHAEDVSYRIVNELQRSIRR